MNLPQSVTEVLHEQLDPKSSTKADAESRKSSFSGFHAVESTRLHYTPSFESCSPFGTIEVKLSRRTAREVTMAVITTT